MKYTYIHSPIDKNLICVETHDVIAIELPPREPIATYSKRIEEEENKAKERYEKIKEKLEMSAK